MSGTLTERQQVDSAPSDPPADGDAPILHRAKAWKRRRNAVRAFSVVTAAAMVGLGWLGYQGYEAARLIKGGATATVISDPAAPGFVAGVDPTPVHLVAFTDDNDALSSLVVFVPDSGGGGSVIWSLGEMVIEVDGTPKALAEVYKSDGFDAARADFEKVLGFGATDALIVSPKDLAVAMSPLGAVALKNPDPVSVGTNGKSKVRFEAGPIKLEPKELGDFLTVRSDGEAPENRSTRAAVLFSALAQRLSNTSATTSTTMASGGVGSAPTTTPAASAGAIDLASILASLGSADPNFIVLPFTRQSFKGSYLYRPDQPAIEKQLLGVVQFPVSSFPGQRPRVRVLNGTSDTSRANRVAPDLARDGGEVLLIGNAKSFDVVTTSVVYSNDAFKEVADRIAKTVGVSAELNEELSDAADIDVVLGSDYQR